MITAAQAKALYDHSGKEVDDYLKFTVEKEITNAAKAGKRTVSILIDSKEPWQHISQLITPFQKAVLVKLTELGYNAKIELYGDSYVPRGLADVDGTGPSHRNYGFVISW